MLIALYTYAGVSSRSVSLSSRSAAGLLAYLGEGEEEGLVAGLVAQPGQSDGPAAVLEHPPVLAERHVQSVVATD